MIGESDQGVLIDGECPHMGFNREGRSRTGSDEVNREALI
jgi:hypothetical protein